MFFYQMHFISCIHTSNWIGKVSADILALKSLHLVSAGIAPNVNLRNSCMQAKKHATERFTLALKLRTDITRNLKEEYHLFHKKK